MEVAEQPSRRRRRRSPEHSPGAALEPEPDADPAKPRGRNPRRSEDRGWRDLVGSGPSQVGVSGALRARDVARPTEDDLAAADRDLVIVRRQWKPPEA